MLSEPVPHPEDDDEPLASVSPLFGDGSAAEAWVEEPVDDPLLDPEADPHADARRYPSTIGGAFYIAILITAATSIGIVLGHDWRLGVKILAGALGSAGALRLVLPQRDAGMLAVRPRLVDVFLLVSVAVLLWWLSVSIPEQPPL